MPSVAIQGKLYHKIGPLEHDPDNPQWPRSFAQLYVHDPALDEASANDDSRRVLAISNGRVTPAGSRGIAFWLFSVADWLLRLGNGTEPHDELGRITLPTDRWPEICEPEGADIGKLEASCRSGCTPGC